MVQIRVVEDPAHPEGGHALIEVEGLTGYAGNGRFRIQREGYVHGNLGPGGWQVAETVLEPDRVDGIDGGVRLAVGPAVVNRVETGPVTIALPDAGASAVAFWPDIAPLHEEASEARRFAGGAAPPRAKPVVPPPEAPRAAEPPSVLRAERELPPPRLETPQPERPAWPLAWIGGLVALVIAGAALGWYFGRPEEAPPQTATAVLPPAAETPQDDSVHAVIARAKSPDEILAAARTKQEKGDFDAAFQLLEEGALRGSALAATLLAKLYDPNGFQPGKPFKAPDMRQAARYYRQGEEGGDAAAKDPRAALKQRLEKDAAGGNTTAQVTLKDFWP